jgi:rfaE bifunctional protein kinase chain/domain
MISAERLAQILDGFQAARVLVVGDLFLDKYLMIDPALEETSIETGLPAHQVIEVRTSPGAAGTVVANLRALDVGRVAVLSVVGSDGEGYDLRRGLDRIGAEAVLIDAPDRLTPTYTKPMVLEPAGQARELSRLDHKNRAPLDAAAEARVIDALRRLAPDVDAVVLADQVEERNCGVLTDAVRDEIARLADAHPSVWFFADSRAWIGAFRGCIVKPNAREAVRSEGRTAEGDDVPAAAAEAAARALARRNGKPVFLTRGENGMLVVEAGGDPATAVPGFRVAGPVDPVGAGDSATAGIVGALCGGASLVEAAFVGNLVASLTVEQLGTTGTTTRAAVARRAAERGGGPATPVSV